MIVHARGEITIIVMNEGFLHGISRTAIAQIIIAVQAAASMKDGLDSKFLVHEIGVSLMFSARFEEVLSTTRIDFLEGGSFIFHGNTIAQTR